MSVLQGSVEQLIPRYLEGKDYSAIAVIADKNTRKHCYPKVKELLPRHLLITVQDGEEYKNLDSCTIIWNKLTEAEFDRHALVIDLGGGVIGDMGGFCASTYKRGIDFIQVPTTLLAQVDASVGGKLGIDFQGFKNHIGVFTQPRAVLIDPAFLATLPERELRSGFAEVIKHCLIRDRAMWNRIRRIELEDMPLKELISHSVETKKAVVTEDPTEKGLRKILNFGHTIGHAVETFYLDKDRLLHGEAIAIGMICESYIAYSKGMLSEAELAEIEEYIFSVYGAVRLDPQDFPAIIALTGQDKKNRGNSVRAALLNGIGDCSYDIVLSRQDILKSLKYYCGIL
ncbi:MAG: 3-dehydroquinate synthase [Leadbetterella sp.]|nr:3-dehydroquinate synthase [Leadbetterella sp.]